MTIKSVTGITDILYAIVQGAAWGTDVAVGAGHGILGLKDSFDKKQPLMPNMATGQGWEAEVDPGFIDAPWGHDAELTYDGLLKLLANIMGTAGAPTKVGATVAYKHQLKLADDLLGLFITYVANYKTTLFIAPSVKLTGMTISGPNKDGRLDISFKGTGFDQLRSTANNTLSSFANVTWPYFGNRVLWKHGVWRMKAASGSALASPGDLVYPSSFKLDITRPQKGEHTSQFGNNVDELTKDGRPVITLQLVFPRFNDDGSARIDAFDSGTVYKLDAAFTSPTAIEAGFPYSMTFRFPQLVMERPTQPFNASTINQTVNFRVNQAQAAPLGMKLADIGYDLVKPFGVDAVCTQTTDPLS